MTKLDEVEVQLASSSSLADDSPALAERHAFLSAAINEAATPALREGGSLLERVGREEPGAQGVNALVIHNNKIIIIILKRQLIGRSNMATVTTRAPYNVRCSYCVRQLVSELSLIHI